MSKQSIKRKRSMSSPELNDLKYLVDSKSQFKINSELGEPESDSESELEFIVPVSKEFTSGSDTGSDTETDESYNPSDNVAEAPKKPAPDPEVYKLKRSRAFYNVGLWLSGEEEKVTPDPIEINKSSSLVNGS